MLIYPKNKKSDQKDDPVWKEDSFLRLRGIADVLVHKTDFKIEDGKNVLAGAYYERVRRELETLEAAKLAQLSKSLGPKAAALKAGHASADRRQQQQHSPLHRSTSCCMRGRRAPRPCRQ